MVAIIIPYFKINFFEATLQSLAEQTELKFKVLNTIALNRKSLIK